MPRKNRYTVFDLMDDKGVFELNSANAGSPDFRGPLEYPRVFYHPKGEERVTQRAETVVTPYGPQQVGEQKELIYRVAKDEEEAIGLEADGWWDHPAKAIAASGKVPPEVGITKSDSRDEEIRRLKAELVKAQASMEAAKYMTPVDAKKTAA